MGKTVTFIADVYPYCVGDVIVLSDEEAKQVDAIAKARKTKVYESGAKGEVDSTAEADRQAENRKLGEVNEKLAEAGRALEDASTAKAAEEGVTDPAGHVPAGTSADTELKTAAAAGKKKR